MLESLAPALPGFLTRQRWFAGRNASVDEVRVVDAVLLAPGPAALVTALVEARVNGEPHRYQLPVGILSGSRLRDLGNEPAGLIGPVDWFGAEGLAVDAVADPSSGRALLARLVSAPAARPGTEHPLDREIHFRRVPGWPWPELPAGQPPVRPIGSEQSNSSVVFGDQLVLKVYRRLEPGLNPDLELTAALAGAGFVGCAAPLAWADGFGGTLLLLQPFFAAGRDAFELAVARARERHEAGGRAGRFAGEARSLGATTAAMHAALAAALPDEVLAGDDRHRRDQRELEAQRLAELDRVAGLVPELARYTEAIAGAYRAARQAPALPAQRIHGDLHLGQFLQEPERGWVVLDFEGEPGRSLELRRRPANPLRDVAGMLRSFDYAAVQPALDAEVATAGGAAEGWIAECRAAFRAGYEAEAAAGGNGRGARIDDVALCGFELEKAVYEVGYEARHRPGWVSIPLGGIARLLGAGG